MLIESWMATTTEERQRYAAEADIERAAKQALAKLSEQYSLESLRGPLLRAVSELVGERVASVDQYCAAFRQWRNALIARGGDKGWKDPTVKAWEEVFGAVSKSSMLDRLIYVGEKLRTRKCPDPNHAGRWQGLDDTRRICLHGCGNTGWLPEPDDLTHAYGRWFLDRFKRMPIFTKEAALALVTAAFEHGNPGVAGEPELEALGLFVTPTPMGFHDVGGGVRLKVRSVYYRASEHSLELFHDHFIPTEILLRPKPVRVEAP